MFSISLENSLGISFFSWQIRDSICDLYSLLSLFYNTSSYHKDLRNASPFVLKNLVHLRTCPHFPCLLPSMPLIRFFMVLKFSPINPVVLKKIDELFTDGRMIIFEGYLIL